MYRSWSGCFAFVTKRLVMQGLRFAPLWLPVVLALGLVPYGTRAQAVRGAFLQDSVRVGRPLLYALRCAHAPELDVFFPDSTFDFSPFEFVGRRYFPTRTGAEGSVDSVLYRLISFSVDSLQRLQVPVYLRTPRDCTAYWTAPDSVGHRRLIANPAATTRLRADVRPVPVSEQVNYPLLLGVLVGVLLGAGLLYGAFGETIRRWIRMLQLRRRYLDFNRTFQRLSRNLSSRPQDLARAERAVILWKRYIERLERIPVSTFTTREIIDTFPEEQLLAEALRELDAAMYGNVFSIQTSPALQTLRTLARERYRRRRREIVQEGRRLGDEVPTETV
jgi:hypothetical protein